MTGSLRGRTRLDVALAHRGLVTSREKARALILAGEVRVGKETVRDAARAVGPDDELEVTSRAEQFASRGGLKLAPVLDRLGIDPADRICADIGASTGGFTDVLLRRGARRVYAVDVGRGLIAWSLRTDPRVVLMEKTNARYLEGFPEPVSLVTVDVSFIGLEKVLPALGEAAPEAEGLVLFKPQFQVERRHIGRGGIVRDPAAVEAAVTEFSAWCESAGFQVLGREASPLKGADGNQEIFVHLRMPSSAPVS